MPTEDRDTLLIRIVYIITQTLPQATCDLAHLCSFRTLDGRVPDFVMMAVLSDYLWRLLAVVSLTPVVLSSSSSGKICVVPASGTNATDDAPAILAAFRECGQGGTISFSPDTTYYVNSVMNVTWLEDAVIDVQGALLVSFHGIGNQLASAEKKYANQKPSGVPTYRTG